MNWAASITPFNGRSSPSVIPSVAGSHNTK